MLSDYSPRIGAEEETGSARFRAAELDRHIGQRLRFVRRLAGWSQRELGARLGLTFQQVQKYENGVNRVSAALLVEVAGLFHVTLDWFVGPYGAASAPPGANSTSYAALLDVLFRTAGHADDTARNACLATICTLVRVDPLRAERLEALRKALAASTADEAAFLLQAARRIGEQAAMEDVAAAGESEGAAGHVLLVDDDPDIIATLSTSLAAAGFAVTTAPGGDEALRLLGDGLPADVLVTDYAMVGMDGVELLAQAALLRPSLPGLVVTGFAGSDRLKALPPTIEVLRKPFRRMELIGRLRLLLDHSRGQAAGQVAGT